MQGNFWREVVGSAISGFMITICFGIVVLLVNYFTNRERFVEILPFILAASVLAAIGVGVCRYIDRRGSR